MCTGRGRGKSRYLHVLDFGRPGHQIDNRPRDAEFVDERRLIERQLQRYVENVQRNLAEYAHEHRSARHELEIQRYGRRQRRIDLDRYRLAVYALQNRVRKTRKVPQLVQISRTAGVVDLAVAAGNDRPYVDVAFGQA